MIRDTKFPTPPFRAPRAMISATETCGRINARMSDKSARRTGERLKFRPGTITHSFLRVINFKFPLQPHQISNITQYEELGFS